MASVTLQSSKPRQRAAHTKSRNGCMSCKARRVRCSEDKPTCRGCLTRGTDCLYNTGIPTQTPGRKPNAVPQPQPIKIIVPRILSGAPRDPFDALPVKMTFRSPEAFYHFVGNRNLLVETTCKDKSSFAASLGLADTDSLWFRHTLCISASYLALYVGDAFKSTYLHHRQGVLEWLAQDLHDTNRPVPVPYMSVVAAMVMSDSASGEDEGAKAHLRGFFTLLETRKRTEPAWRFYDSMLKRVVMMAVFLISSVRPNREHPEAESKAGNPAIRDRLCSPMIPSMFTQMVNEFLRMPILMGSPYATRRADGQTLAWLHKVLREANAAGRREKDPWNDPSHLVPNSRAVQAWVAAISAYALVVGTIDWSERIGASAAAPRGISEDLADLRAWSDDVVDTWSAEGGQVTSNISERIADKIFWLESARGIKVIGEIAKLSQHQAAFAMAVPTTLVF